MRRITLSSMRLPRVAGDVGSLWQVDLEDILANQLGKTGPVGPCIGCWAERLPQQHGEAGLRLEHLRGSVLRK